MHLITECCTKQTGLSTLLHMAADLVRDDGSSPQKIAYCVKMIILTGLHQGRPLVLITHVKVCSSLRNKITDFNDNIKVTEIKLGVTHLDKSQLYMQMRSENYYRVLFCVSKKK